MDSGGHFNQNPPESCSWVIVVGATVMALICWALMN